MENPVLVDVTRGRMVESMHRCAFALVNGGGDVVLSAGDIDRAVFPRSAIKVFQAIPMVEMGAAARFGLEGRELALCCASHSGEPEHVALAAAILERAGLDASALECGSHWPFDPEIARAMASRGDKPTQLHNNCSGKHSGFLCTAIHRGEAIEGYVGENHPVQLRIKETIQNLTGSALTQDVCGTDGCSIPTYAAPLRGFAHGFARLVSGEGIEAPRASAGRELIEACMAHPFEMSGTDRACKTLMEIAPGRVFAKTGAEGVFCGALPDLGLGFALKIDDGASRASETLVAAVIAEALKNEDAALSARFAELAERTLTNWEGIDVGAVKARVK